MRHLLASNLGAAEPIPVRGRERGRGERGGEEGGEVQGRQYLIAGFVVGDGVGVLDLEHPIGPDRASSVPMTRLVSSLRRMKESQMLKRTTGCRRAAVTAPSPDRKRKDDSKAGHGALSFVSSPSFFSLSLCPSR